MPDNIPQKRCSACCLWLPFSSFSLQKGKGDGLRTFCRECAAKRQREAYTQVWRRDRWLREKYGITSKIYDRMLAEQGGVCYICKQPETHTNNKDGIVVALSVDHDHQTGDVRRLLCHKCNIKVGIVETDPKELEAARAYVEEMKNRETSGRAIQLSLIDPSECKDTQELHEVF